MLRCGVAAPADNTLPEGIGLRSLLVRDLALYRFLPDMPVTKKDQSDLMITSYCLITNVVVGGN